jgi:hypothetical protein
MRIHCIDRGEEPMPSLNFLETLLPACRWR